MKEIKTIEETQITKQDFPIENLLSEAIKNNVPVETMERLLAMRRELKKERAEEAYIQAMANFQAECPTIKKDRIVQNKDKTTTRYKFAPIESIDRQTKEIRQKNGFSYNIDTKIDGLKVKVLCKVTHIMGHSEVSEFEVPIDKESYMNEQQRFASALTFAKRYAFCNAFGILTADDDDDAKSNDKKEASSYDKVLAIVKTLKDIGKLIKTDELLQKDKGLTDKQKAELSKMIKDKVSVLENNG